MNLLAHQLLSQDDPHLSIGNFVADMVKGSQYKTFEKGIQKGILLHRRIDNFMDTHPLTLRGTKRLHEVVGKYASVAIDVVFDHFIAANWNEFQDLTLEKFTLRQYEWLLSYSSIMPARMQMMLYYMSKENWLLHYRDMNGIFQALNGMSKRIKHNIDLTLVIPVVEQYYELYQQESLEFTHEIQEKVPFWLEEITASLS